jgi:hypothetical protein
MAGTARRNPGRAVPMAEVARASLAPAAGAGVQPRWPMAAGHLAHAEDDVRSLVAFPMEELWTHIDSAKPQASLTQRGQAVDEWREGVTRRSAGGSPGGMDLARDSRNVASREMLLRPEGDRHGDGPRASARCRAGRPPPGAGSLRVSPAPQEGRGSPPSTPLDETQTALAGRWTRWLEQLGVCGADTEPGVDRRWMLYSPG